MGSSPMPGYYSQRAPTEGWKSEVVQDNSMTFSTLNNDKTVKEDIRVETSNIGDVREQVGDLDIVVKSQDDSTKHDVMDCLVDNANVSVVGTLRTFESDDEPSVFLIKLVRLEGFLTRNEVLYFTEPLGVILASQSNKTSQNLGTLR
jgi:hypothetical protein